MGNMDLYAESGFPLETDNDESGCCQQLPPLRNVLASADGKPYLDAWAKEILRDPDVNAYIVRGALSELRPYSMACVRDYFLADSTGTSDREVDPEPYAASVAARRNRSLDRESTSLAEGAVHFDFLQTVWLPRIPRTGELPTAFLSSATGILEGDIGGGIEIGQLTENDAPGPRDRVIDDHEMQVKLYPQAYRDGRNTYYRARQVSEERGTVFSADEYEKVLDPVSIWIYPRPARRELEVEIWPPETTAAAAPGQLITAGHRREREISIYLGKSDTGVTGPRATIEMVQLLQLLFTDMGRSAEEISNILADRFQIRNARRLAERGTEMIGLARQYYEVGQEEERVRIEPVLAEKDQEIAELGQTIAEKDRRIAELEAKLKVIGVPTGSIE